MIFLIKIKMSKKEIKKNKAEQEKITQDFDDDLDKMRGPPSKKAKIKAEESDEESEKSLMKLSKAALIEKLKVRVQMTNLHMIRLLLLLKERHKRKRKKLTQKKLQVKRQRRLVLLRSATQSRLFIQYQQKSILFIIQMVNTLVLS